MSNVAYIARLVLSFILNYQTYNKLVGCVYHSDLIAFFGVGTGNNSKRPCASANYIKPNLRVTRSRGVSQASR